MDRALWADAVGQTALEQVLALGSADAISEALQQGRAVRPEPPHRYLEMYAPALAEPLLSAHACCLWHQEDC